MEVMYQGMFFDEATKALLIAKAPGPRLHTSVPSLHVTYEFFRKGKPQFLFPASLLGQTFEVLITHYGNDEENEGFTVDLLEAGNLKVGDRLLYQGADVPHITLSAAIGALMRNTKDLDFYPIESFMVKGRLGLFTPKGVVYDAPTFSYAV